MGRRQCYLLIFRFGIPNSIITDLGSNFTSSEFFDFCEQKSIQIKYASVAHPRANGQVERANGMILEALRKKVFDKNEKFAGKWIRELPYVVWSLRTQPSRALHGNTPFFMVYGSEAVLPADLRFGAPRLVFENIAEAEATRLEDIDVLEEPYVVWSLRTQPSRALHGNTPFFMVYGSKAVLPADLKFGAPRLVFESIAEAEATRLEDIDVLEEERLNTVIQSARYQQTLRRYHDKVVRR